MYGFGFLALRQIRSRTLHHTYVKTICSEDILFLNTSYGAAIIYARELLFQIIVRSNKVLASIVTEQEPHGKLVLAPKILSPAM